MNRAGYVLALLIGLGMPAAEALQDLEAQLILTKQSIAPDGETQLYFGLQNNTDQTISLNRLPCSTCNPLPACYPSGCDLNVVGPVTMHATLPLYGITVEAHRVAVIPVRLGEGWPAYRLAGRGLPEGLYTVSIYAFGNGYTIDAASHFTVASGAESPKLQILQPDLTGDAQVNVLDMSLTSASFGRTWPPTLRSGQTLTFYVGGADPEGAPLTYTATNLPTGASFTNRQFLLKPSASQTGSYTVTFTVSDGTFTDTVTLPITVTP